MEQNKIKTKNDNEILIGHMQINDTGRLNLSILEEYMTFSAE